MSDVTPQNPGSGKGANGSAGSQPREGSAPEESRVVRRIPKSTLAGGGKRGIVEGPGGGSGNGGDRERRDFFNEATREVLGPLAGMLERKIHPLLAALEAIPDEAERIASASLPGLLDQPQNGPVSLPVVSEPVQERLLRPPGADPGVFESLCTKCRKCVEACPAQAILMDPYGYVGEGLPYIVASSSPCVVCSDLACMPACPTGALRVLDRLSIKMGTARVDTEQCLRNHGENCTLCVDVCPITKEGAHPEKGEALVIHAESGRVRVRKNACIGCGLCESRCPTHPQAIQVVPAKPKLDPIVA